MTRGRAIEAEEWLTDALAHYEERDSIRARALTHRAELDDDLGMLNRALALWRELGDGRGEGMVLESIGWAEDAHGNYTASQRAHERSIAVRERGGVPAIESGLARAGLCHVLVATGQAERAQETASQLLTISDPDDTPLMHELALHFLADVSLISGYYAEAEKRYIGALDFAQSKGLINRIIDEVVGVAMAIAGQGDAERAIRLASTAHAKAAELRREDDAWWKSMQERLLGAARSSLSADALAAAERYASDTPFESAVQELLVRR